LMYHKGLGVPQDYKEAIKWFRLAAEQGYAEAQYNLSLKDADGRGVLQDYKETVNGYQKEEIQGNDKEAVKSYSKSLEQGNDDTQGELEQSQDKGGKSLIIIVVILIIFLLWFYRLIKKRNLERDYQEQEREKEKEQVHREQERQYRRKKEKEQVRREQERQYRREKERQEQSRQKREKPKNRNEKDRSYEEILGLSSGWTKSDLKSAYRKKCQQIHPDKWKDFPEDIAQRLEKEYKEVQKAYKYLSKK